MAKIIDRIENYAELSAEDKLKALEALEVEDNSSEIERLKNAVSKANSESAEWKRKHNALLSEDEKKKQEDAEERARLEKRLAELEKEKLVAKHTADYVKLGYDPKLAEETAAALADGDNAKVFANQQKFLETYKKTIIADELKKTPRPQGGQGGNGMTLEKLRKLSDAEYAQFAQEHPEEYKALYSEQNE